MGQREAFLLITCTITTGFSSRSFTGLSMRRRTLTCSSFTSLSPSPEYTSETSSKFTCSLPLFCSKHSTFNQFYQILAKQRKSYPQTAKGILRFSTLTLHVDNNEENVIEQDVEQESNEDAYDFRRHVIAERKVLARNGRILFKKCDKKTRSRWRCHLTIYLSQRGSQQALEVDSVDVIKDAVGNVKDINEAEQDVKS